MLGTLAHGALAHGCEGEKKGLPLSSSGSDRFLQLRLGSVVAVVPSVCCVGCGSDAIADGECVPDSSAHLKRFVHGHLNPGPVPLATLGGPRRRIEECVEQWEALARNGLSGLAACKTLCLLYTSPSPRD